MVRNESLLENLCNRRNLLKYIEKKEAKLLEHMSIDLLKDLRRGNKKRNKSLEDALELLTILRKNACVNG